MSDKQQSETPQLEGRAVRKGKEPYAAPSVVSRAKGLETDNCACACGSAAGSGSGQGGGKAVARSARR